MSFFWRTLTYHWRTHLAVGLGVVVATAVLTGALVVGDSVRGSLRELTLQRLGRVDYALTAGRFFRQELASDLAQSLRDENYQVIAAILLQGSVERAGPRGQTLARSSGVGVVGVNERFWTLFHGDKTETDDHTKAHGWPPVGFAQKQRSRAGQSWMSTAGVSAAALNEPLAGELDAQLGDAVLIRVERPSAVPRDALLGDRSDLVASLRLQVGQVIPPEGLGRFSLRVNQQSPKNIYVPLPELQRALGRSGQANTLLVASNSRRAMSMPEAKLVARQLDRHLREAWQLEDLGLRLVRHTERGYLSLESERMLLEPRVADKALAISDTLNMSASPTLTYLANTIAVGDRAIPYSTLSALDPWAEPPLGPLPLAQGTASAPLKDRDELNGKFAGEILLNQWAADELQAQPGGTVRLRYYDVESRGRLSEVENHFLLRGVVELKGPAADPGLTPEYPGITDAASLADWDPPFPIDLSRIRPRDEEYWDEYRAAPKAFVGLDTGQRLWSSRFGNLTSIRLAPAPGQSVGEAADQFGQELLEQLEPASLGLAFQPVKAQGLAAVSGSTDFGMLFLGFSFFLIVAAAMLVGLMFRLGVERRAPQIGILLASGYRVGQVRGLLLAEGAVVAALSALAGLGGAVAYAALMLAGLRTWWHGAVRTTTLELHVTAVSLVLGYVVAVAVALAAVVWGMARVGRISVRDLLVGNISPEKQRGMVWGRGRVAAEVAVATAGLAVLLMLAGLFGVMSPQGAFFGSGTLLLIAALAMLRTLLGRSRRAIRGGGLLGTALLGARNGSRYPGRSLLVVGLVAAATFVIVSVAANRRDPTALEPRRDSGNGGFALLARSSIPLMHDLNTAEGRQALALPNEAEQVLDIASVYPLRERPSDDASCLNLYVPTEPPLLGVPNDLIERGGFRFSASQARTPEERQNPWTLLHKPLAPGVVPTIGDANTLQWTFHKGLGDELEMTDDRGMPVRLRVVGVLQNSIFQSQLLISEANFVEHFPERSGYRYFLIELDPLAGSRRIAEVQQFLERHLGPYGFDARRTSEQLAEYLAVQNTYLSTFQALGGLGLLLGTLGLAAVMWRNVLERRGELALLGAVGFRRAMLAVLVLAENGFLLVLGLAAGTVSALLAVAPHLASSGADVPWTSLAGTLVLVLVVGMASAGAAVWTALRTPLIPALRAE